MFIQIIVIRRRVCTINIDIWINQSPLDILLFSSELRSSYAVYPRTSEHIASIQKTYAWHVMNGIATFETVPPTVEEIKERLTNVFDAKTPWIVAEVYGVVVNNRAVLFW